MEKTTFILNGKPVEVSASPLKRLIDVLREDLEFTGAKEGCGEGECGACSVLLEDELVNSCLIPLGRLENRRVTTIEGLRESKRYEVLKEGFEEAGAVQCGFCTPGMIIAGEALLRNNPHPEEEDIKRGISGNLCRCTGYNMIAEGIKIASKRGDGLW